MRHRDEKGIIDEEPVGGGREEEGCFSGQRFMLFIVGVSKNREGKHFSKGINV